MNVFLKGFVDGLIMITKVHFSKKEVYNFGFFCGILVVITILAYLLALIAV